MKKHALTLSLLLTPSAILFAPNSSIPTTTQAFLSWITFGKLGTTQTTTTTTKAKRHTEPVPRAGKKVPAKEKRQNQTAAARTALAAKRKEAKKS